MKSQLIIYLMLVIMFIATAIIMLIGSVMVNNPWWMHVVLSLMFPPLLLAFWSILLDLLKSDFVRFRGKVVVRKARKLIVESKEGERRKFAVHPRQVFAIREQQHVEVTVYRRTKAVDSVKLV